MDQFSGSTPRDEQRLADEQHPQFLHSDAWTTGLHLSAFVALSSHRAGDPRPPRDGRAYLKAAGVLVRGRARQVRRTPTRHKTGRASACVCCRHRGRLDGSARQWVSVSRSTAARPVSKQATGPAGGVSAYGRSGSRSPTSTIARSRYSPRSSRTKCCSTSSEMTPTSLSARSKRMMTVSGRREQS